MNKRVLVTGVGGGVGQSVLKSLANSHYEAVGYDSSPLAAGLYLTKHSWVGANATDSDYIHDLINAARKFNCIYLIPGHDVELKVISSNLTALENAGLKTIISSNELISIADDKFETAQLLSENGFDAPITVNLQDFDWQGNSVVLKPRKGGARSRDTFIVHNEEDFNRFSEYVDPTNTVVQEWCDGDEYTCGTITFNNEFRGAIPMKRELRAGDTYKAFSKKSEVIESVLQQMCELLKPIGPCNFQLKFDGNRVRVFEINARFSGTTYLRKLSGFDEVVYLLDLIEGKSTTSLMWQETNILRYWSEIAVENFASRQS